MRPDRAFALTPAAILYEDDLLIAVDKPVDLSTVPTADPSRPSLVRAVEAFLVQAGRSNRPLGVHQRLDRDTSGVVLFAKDPKANPGLAEAFAKREVLKTYDVVAARPAVGPPPSFEVTRALVRRGRRGMAGVDAAAGQVPLGEEARDGEVAQSAHTQFTVRDTLPRAIVLEARPLTGRKHQIRVHLAEAGMPILGDPLYGRPPRGAGMATRAPRLMLHARGLSLRHPVTGEPLLIESPWPPDFRKVVEALRLEAPLRSAAGGGRRPRWPAPRPEGPRSRARAGGAAGRKRKGRRRR